MLELLSFEDLIGYDNTKSKELFLIDGNNYIKFLYQNYTSGKVLLSSFLDNYYYSYPEAKWFWDGEGYKERIQAIYPGYKAKRKYQEDYQFFLFRQKIVEDPRFEYAKRVPGEEADTQIRDYIVDNEIKEGCIFSSDADLLQLRKYGDFKFPYVRNTSKFLKMDHIDLAVYKTLVGDSSDNISGLKGFGEKAFSKLTRKQVEIIYKGLLEGSEFSNFSGVGEKLEGLLDDNFDEMIKIFNIVHL